MTELRQRATRSRTTVGLHPTIFISVVMGIGLAVLVVVFRSNLLPAKFSYDGARIRDISLDKRPSYGDQSYQRTADVYAFLHLGNHPLLAGGLGAAFFVLALALVLRKPGFDVMAPRILFVIGCVLFLAGVYLGYYSKDVFVLPITCAVALGSGRRRSDLLVVLLMLGYSILFRPYWFIITGLYVGIRLLQESRYSLKRSVWLILVAFVGVCLFFYFVLGVPADHYRTTVNETRQSSIDAASMVVRFVEGPEPLSGTINVLLTSVSLMLPVPLALNGGAYYLFLAVLIASLWVLFLRRVGPAWRSESYAAKSSVALILALVLTQALFEPDYGSALRHLTPVLPLFVLVIAQDRSARRAGDPTP